MVWYIVRDAQISLFKIVEFDGSNQNHAQKAQKNHLKFGFWISCWTCTFFFYGSPLGVNFAGIYCIDELFLEPLWFQRVQNGLCSSKTVESVRISHNSVHIQTLAKFMSGSGSHISRVLLLIWMIFSQHWLNILFYDYASSFCSEVYLCHECTVFIIIVVQMYVHLTCSMCTV